ncbi:MAG: pilus assembly protein [Polyangiaceae bacterium]|nr:pilus assembly protein [Polyangiaceae bacterium]
MKQKRGAAIVEFVVVLMPLLALFFGSAQAHQLYQANLIVKHASIVAVRAAAVLHDQEGHELGDPTEVKDAAYAAIGPYNSDTETAAKTKPPITLLGANTAYEGGGGQYGMLRTTVETSFACTVPLGSLIVCGADRKKIVKQSSLFPHQGADYEK